MTIKQSVPTSDIRLINVYERPDRHSILFKLLQERDESVNISHKKLPTWEQHVKFIEGHPYQAWYFIGPEPKGACYLTHQNEIGIFVFRAHQGQGIGPQAIQEIIKKHGSRHYLANINPANEKSIQMFGRLGFNLIQYTYELNA